MGNVKWRNKTLRAVETERDCTILRRGYSAVSNRTGNGGHSDFTDSSIGESPMASHPILNSDVPASPKESK